MLSKVLKGADARQVKTMAFATTSIAVEPPRLRPAETGATDSGERTALFEKIRLLETGLAEAKHEAFNEGHRLGAAQAHAAVSPVMERLNASISEIVGMRPELRRLAEKDAVELALQIARRVLHRELSVDANALNALARVVFDRLTRSESWQLTVHPQFADAIRGALPASSAQKVRVEGDPSCVPGTLVVRSEDGVIDASVDSQLEEIGRGLTDRLTRK